MITRAKVSRINFYRTGKDGQPLVTKSGKQYMKASVLFEGQEEWRTGFIWDDRSPLLKWAVGTEADVVFEDGEYKNFRLATDEDRAKDRMERIEARQDELESRIEAIEREKERVEILKKATL